MEPNSNSDESHYLAGCSDDSVPERAAYDAPDSPDAFHTTVELTASGVCHMDPAGRFLYVNPALCRLTGYSREELLSLTIQDITHPDDVAATVEEFRRLIAGEVAACRMEKRCCRKDGAVVWVDVNSALRRTSSGAPLHIISIVEDISERKQLEDQLRTANQQLALAVEQSQQQANDMNATFDAIADLIVVFDEAGNVRRTNPAARAFTGIQQTIVAARRHMGLVDAQGQPILPDQWVSARVLRGETLTGARGVDMLAHAEAGREVFFNISGAPVRDGQGQIVGGVIVLRDVTERRQLERHTQEALQTLLQMAEALVAPAPSLAPSPALVAQRGDGAAIAPPLLNPVAQRLAELAGRVLGCQRVGIVALQADRDIMHPVALTGLPPEHVAAWCAGLQGRSIHDFVEADSLRKLRTGQAVQIDLERPPLRNVAHGGPVALAVPLLVGDQLVGALALGFEQEPHLYTEDELALAEAVGQLTALVIERERLLQEREEARASALALQVANRRMEEFLGIAGHELRTPLASLLGNVQLIERRLAHTSSARKSIEDLAGQLQMVRTTLEPTRRQGKRLTRLVGDLMNASRIKTGTLDLQLQILDLTTIVRDAVEEQRQAEPQRIIDLVLPGDAPVSVLADADRVGQVVTNYLTNALKYSPEDRPVEVRLRVDGDIARVSVRDTGIGLPPEEQLRVWDLFYRAPGINVQSGSGIGLGLGLHICKTIIERHGGKVGVESAVGQGATFWFTLPLAAPSQASPSAPSTAQ